MLEFTLGLLKDNFQFNSLRYLCTTNSTIISFCMRKFSLLLLSVMMQTVCFAQVTVKGNVVNERGEAVEYVSIGFEDDSVGVISDAKGHFTIKIPAGRKKELSFSHVSYLTTEVPYQEYAKGSELTVVLKDRVVELAEVVIGKKNKPKTIVGKGIPAPGLVGTSGHGSDLGPEGGVLFSCSKSYVISDILINIAGITFEQCKVSINVYERQGKRFVNIHQKPIYETLTKSKNKYTLDVRPEEDIVLKPKKEYYVSINVVDGYGEKGFLNMKAYMKNGLYRNAVKGKTKKFPICPAIQVKGYEVE